MKILNFFYQFLHQIIARNLLFKMTYNTPYTHNLLSSINKKFKTQKNFRHLFISNFSAFFPKKSYIHQFFTLFAYNTSIFREQSPIFIVLLLFLSSSTMMNHFWCLCENVSFWGGSVNVWGRWVCAFWFLLTRPNWFFGLNFLVAELFFALFGLEYFWVFWERVDCGVKD